jgi:hypothetical protein
MGPNTTFFHFLLKPQFFSLETGGQTDPNSVRLGSMGNIIQLPSLNLRWDIGINLSLESDEGT